MVPARRMVRAYAMKSGAGRTVRRAWTAAGVVNGSAAFVNAMPAFTVKTVRATTALIAESLRISIIRLSFRSALSMATAQTPAVCVTRDIAVQTAPFLPHALLSAAGTVFALAVQGDARPERRVLMRAFAHERRR